MYVIVSMQFELTYDVAEVEKVFRKVEEGVEIFETIWDKVRMLKISRSIDVDKGLFIEPAKPKGKI